MTTQLDTLLIRPHPCPKDGVHHIIPIEKIENEATISSPALLRNRKGLVV